jgi:hypothetical protein
MVWNEETAQKPPEDTVRDIRGERRSLAGSGPVPVDIHRDSLLLSFRSFETEYQLRLSEYLPSGSDTSKPASQAMDLANRLKPLSCSRGWV